MDMTSEDRIIEHIGAGGKLGPDDDLSPGYRGELRRLMVTFVDSELAGAAGFVDMINSAPGLRERSVAARIVSEKFAHAELVLGLLEPFGVNAGLYITHHPWQARLVRDVDLGNRRVGGDKRLNVFHYPLQGWGDSVTMNMVMGGASAIQLGELTDCSYIPLAQTMRTIVAKEAEHARLGEKGLEQVLERANTRLAAQASLNYWYPRVAATFGRTDSQGIRRYQEYGLRRASNADLLARWKNDVAARVARLGLEAPAL